MELASFYSDIASIETTSSTPPLTDCEAIPPTTEATNDANVEPVKPKKKKTLKLQYKQVDEVSSMMAKWRKAQEELVG